MIGDPPQLGKLLARLLDADLDFVLVGALAVNAWGHIRATTDIDIVPNPASDNLDRLAAALVEIGGRVEVQGRRTTSDAVATFLHAGDKTFVVTELGGVDVLQGLPQIPRYGELRTEAVLTEFEGRRAWVCSLAHLGAMKRAANRPLDLEDLEALRTAHPEAFEDDEEESP